MAFIKLTRLLPGDQISWLCNTDNIQWIQCSIAAPAKTEIHMIDGFTVFVIDEFTDVEAQIAKEGSDG